MPDKRPAAVLTTIGAALIVIGCFMPWISASSGFGTISRNGMDGGDGKLLLPLGILIGVIGISRLAGFVLPSWLGKAELLLIIGAGVITLIDYANASSRVGDISNDVVSASVGAGLYVIAIGVGLALWGGLAWGKGPEEPLRKVEGPNGGVAS